MSYNYACGINQVRVCEAEWKLWAVCWLASRCRPYKCKYLDITWKLGVKLIYVWIDCNNKSVLSLNSPSGWAQHCVSLWPPYPLPSLHHWYDQEALCGGIHGLCSYSPEAGLWGYAIRGQRSTQTHSFVFLFSYRHNSFEACKFKSTCLSLNIILIFLSSH